MNIDKLIEEKTQSFTGNGDYYFTYVTPEDCKKIIEEVLKQRQELPIDIVMRSTLERKEAEYKAACEWFKTEYDSSSDEDEVAEQEKVCYGLNEQVKLLRYLLSEYCV